MKRHGLKKQLAWSAFAFLILIVSIGIVGSYRLTVGRYEIRTPKLHAALRLVLVADLHSCRYGENQSDLIQAIDALRPDALMFCGDIADDDIPLDNAKALMDALAKRYPCFYVTGNHEYWSNEAEKIKFAFRESGAIVLEGEYVPLVIRGEKIIVCGVDDPESGTFRPQLAEAAKGTETDLYTVLLSHRPEQFDRYVAERFDLVLSGHAHGGLWRIPGILNGFVAPNQGFFPKYTDGQYTEGTTTMIVSKGLARESTRIPRFFNPTELVVIDLLPTEPSS